MGAAAQTLHPGPHHSQGSRPPPLAPSPGPSHPDSSRHPQPPWKALHSEGLLLHLLPSSPPRCSPAARTPWCSLTMVRAKDGTSKSPGSEGFESSNSLGQSPTSPSPGSASSPASPALWRESWICRPGRSSGNILLGVCFPVGCIIRPWPSSLGIPGAREAAEVVWFEQGCSYPGPVLSWRCPEQVETPPAPHSDLQEQHRHAARAHPHHIPSFAMHKNPLQARGSSWDAPGDASPWTQVLQVLPLP